MNQYRYNMDTDDPDRRMKTDSLNAEPASALLDNDPAESSATPPELILSVFENSVHPVFLLDRKGRILFCNPAAADFLDIAEDADTGLNLQDFLEPEDSGLSGGGEEFWIDRDCSAELRFRINGFLKYLEMNITVGSWSGEDTIIGIGYDITDRKRVEADLLESKERYASIVENITIGISLLSPDMRILDMNRRMREWFPKVDVDAHPVCYKSFYDRLQDDVCDYCPAAKTLQTGEVHDVEVTSGTGKERRNYYIRSSPVFDQYGNVTAVVEMVEDITERKQMTASLAQTDRMAGIGLLAAGVVHEINNPLMYVLYTLEKLARDLPPVGEAIGELLDQDRNSRRLKKEKKGLSSKNARIDPEKFVELAKRTENAREGATRIRKIVRDLKTFSRVEEDRLVPVSLHDIIEGALNMAFNEIKYRARIIKDYGRIPVIRANDGRLAQVFLNLLVNAAHAIDEGAVDQNEIRIKTSTRDKNAVIEISDTGCGIKQDDLENIFEPFFSTKEIGVGSGLGLSICQNIIVGIGGSIDIESTVGEGSTFTVEIPARQGVPAQDSTEADDPVNFDEPAVRGRVLIVEDEPHILGILTRVLGDDHEIIQASSGSEAQRIIGEGEIPDVIVCDLMMPQITGMDLYGWILSLNPSLASKMIFITGGAFTPKAKKFINEVDNLHLEKPIDLKNLRKVIREQVIASKSR